MTTRAAKHAACAAIVSASALTGCMQFDSGLEGDIPLHANVKDWREEVIYQLLVDRFADGDDGNNINVDRTAMGKWHGGDWLGVEQRLDYLHELGVTTLWISPVVKNVETDAGFDGYHGYWAQDLTATNPHFGDLPALRHMVAAAHERGMKIIVDIVTNHLGQLFFYDINMNGEPDERVAGSGTTSTVEHINEYDPDFDPRGVQARTSLGESGPAPIIFLYDPATNHVPPLPEVFQQAEAYNRKGRTYNFDDPDQLLHGDFPGGLKDLNTTRCDVKDAMVDSYARWVELTDVDGFRIDTVKHVEREFWRYFSQKVRQRLAKKGKKNFFMFGEAFDGRDSLVGAYTKNDLPSQTDIDRENQCVHDGVPLTGDQLDGVFYFPQYYTAIRDVFQLSLSTDRIEQLWKNRDIDYGSTPAALGTGIPPTHLLVNFLDNHDVPRFLFSGRGVDALKNAILFQFTAQGVPCVYYGTEQELSGGNDPGNREDLWSTGYDTSKPTFAWIQKLIHIRHAYAALMRGDTKVVWSTPRTGDEPDAGIFAFERAGGDAADSYALVVLNTNPNHDSSPEFNGAPMKVSDVVSGKTLVDVLSPDHKTYSVGPDGSVSITLPATSGAVLIPQEQVASKP